MKAKLAQFAAELVVGWVVRGIKKRRAKKSAKRKADLLRRFTKR